MKKTNLTPHNLMRSRILAGTLALALIAVPTTKHLMAAANPNLTQSITSGVLSVDIVDATYTPVANPAVAFNATTTSFADTTTTGTLGTNTQRVYVKNPNAANNGFRVDIAGSAPTALWTATGGFTYDFNEIGGSTDGADVDTKGGQLTVNPATGAKNNGQSTATCATDTNISLGNSEAFAETGVINNEVDILNAAAASADVIDCYVTGVSMSQLIPKEQAAAADYTIGSVLTVTAL